MSGSANVFLSEFRVPRSCVKYRALIFSFRKCHFNGVALRYNSVHSSNKRLSQGLYQQEMTLLSTRTGFFLLLYWKVGDWQGEVWRQERWEQRGGKSTYDNTEALTRAYSPLPTPAHCSANSPTQMLLLHAIHTERAMSMTVSRRGKKSSSYLILY